MTRSRLNGGILGLNNTTSLTSAYGVFALAEQQYYVQAGKWPTTAGGFNINNSLRFRSSASAYLNRTFGTSTNDQKLTLSFWGKKNVNVGQGIFDTMRSYATAFWFDSSNVLNIYVGSPGTAQGSYLWQSTPVYRDPSAWYHVVINIDTTQATATNRVAAYINGVQITAWATQQTITQNINVGTSGNPNRFGFSQGTSGAQSLYWDGYFAEVNFIDGQALAASSFGAYDTNGVWQPIKYSGTYGTNGFYLTFGNTTSTATLGNDSSGNSNTWTVNNVSLTAGSTYDSMNDSPTVTSATVANYATLNPIAGAPTTTIAFSNANLTVTISPQAGGTPGAYGTMGMPSGKWYWEVQWVSGGNALYNGIGIANFINPANYRSSSTYFLYLGNPLLRFNTGGGDTTSAYGAAWTAGDIIGVALDLSAGTLTFYKNGTSQGVAATGITASTWYPLIVQETNANTNVFAANFGQRPFSYTPPSGFVALNTYNLPTPTIANGAQYMAATTYTGNGSTQTISDGGNNTIGTTFQPDFVWVKNRSASSSHILVDSVRGAANVLVSNVTSAEQSLPNYITSLNSNGFSVGNGSGGTILDINTNTNSYVGWQWKANGTGVSNTNGSITSTVSANTTAGFSIVSYTGNTTAGATVGHGLGVAPNMIITKNRDGVTDWWVYHSSLGATQYIVLNTTAASVTSANAWNNTAPTSTVFSLGASSPSNANRDVAYCWSAVSGYSAFGSYTGNGSTDGPFVYTGFRPRFLLVKRTDTVESWNIVDTSRDTYNQAGTNLYPNLANAESTNNLCDLLSNGFKLRNTWTGANTSGGTYIYAAFAENPFNTARAR